MSLPAAAPLPFIGTNHETNIKKHIRRLSYNNKKFKKTTAGAVIACIRVITRFRVTDAPRAKRGRRSCCRVIMGKCASRVPKSWTTIAVRTWLTCILCRSYFSARFW